MALLRRKVRKFSSPESFRLFMEGLRSLQSYDDEAGKNAPDRATLDKLLQSAHQQFHDCVSLFPKDLLPRYYLGIVLGVEAQTEQARDFEALASTANFTTLENVPLLSAKVTEPLQRAVDEFGETARRARGGDLRSYALYNQAQALAKMDPQPPDRQKGEEQTPWKKAEEILLSISPDLLDRLPLSKWLLLRFPRSFSRPLDRLAKVAGWVSDSVEGAPGIASTLASAAAESKAMKLQIELSYLFIELRTEVYRQLPAAAEPVRAPSAAAQSPSLLATVMNTVSAPLSVKIGTLGSKPDARLDESRFGSIKRALRDLMTTIEKSNIPVKTKEKMIQDYWNKSAFVTWERAMVSKESNYIEQAARYLEHVEEKLWTPRQMNEVRLALARGDKDHAMLVLHQILGVSTSDPASVQSPPDEAGSIAEFIAHMATEPDPIAIASNLRRTYPVMSANLIRAVSKLLAGKIHPALLDLIFRQYSGCQ